MIKGVRVWGMTDRGNRKDIGELTIIKKNQNEVESKKKSTAVSIQNGWQQSDEITGDDIFLTRVGQVIPNRDSDMTSATKFQKRKDDLREHDMLLKELRNTQRFGIVVEDRPRSSTLHVREYQGNRETNRETVIAFDAMLTSLKVKRSNFVYTRRVKSNEVFEEMLNRNNEDYYEHGFLANCCR
ncbi:hypothetical protein V1478_001652 [Vespula squamosa]|uniref:Uncharacterized protein n=1 Tax=Vespula squamosa TaxID=30214 RepID=A0ABD2C230_VESSQ